MPPKLLIIDDDPVSLKMLEIRLTSLGFLVITAAPGIDAIM